ncbi:MAG: NRDE family protein [Pirellulales bacterium]|nr:NRDE family protein [Pirellulales bacterium]
MCTMAILYRTARGTPILVAANREERYDRPTQYPKIQSGSPRVVCGIDRKAGGTWLGVNQHGLFSAVSNRRKLSLPAEPRSRGLLCRELLELRTAKEAAAHAAEELSKGIYAGANYVCADGRYAAVVHGGDNVEIVELTPGLHVVSDGDVDDPHDPRHEFVRRMLTLHTLDSAVTFLAVASRIFARRVDDEGRRGVVVAGPESGTVSSTLLSLPRKIQHAVYQYAPGPPCDCAFDDLSALLRQVLSAERMRKAREGNGKTVKPSLSDKTKKKTKAKPKVKAKVGGKRRTVKKRG